MDRRKARSRSTRYLRILAFVTISSIATYTITCFVLWGFSANRLASLAAEENLDLSNPSLLLSTLESLQTDAERVASLSDQLPIRLAVHIPGVGGDLTDARTISKSIGQLDPVFAAGIEMARTVSSLDAKNRIFSNGKVNLEVIESLIAREPEVTQAIYEASWTINNAPCSKRLCPIFTKLNSQLEQSKTLLSVMEVVLPTIPPALGKGRVSRYLITIGNEAELRASGGAPLSIALIELNQGALKLVTMGQISTEIFPGNPKVSWNHLMEIPFVSDSLQPIKFVNANMHPDFRIAGEEILRGWVAHGGLPIDGVISVDSTALAAVLSATGSVVTPGFGEITGANFKQRMLIDSYRELSNDGQRQMINNLIGQTLITRATGSDFPQVIRALLSTASGRHFQMYFKDVNLQLLNSYLHLDGTTPDKRITFGSDIIALYSKNRNQSKSDVFQKRQIIQDVVIHQDGSADVKRTINVTNDVPAGTTGVGTIGYTTLLNSSYWCAYVPATAQDIELTVPNGYPPMAIYENEADSKFAFTRGGEIQPGQQITMVLRYRLPAGTLKNGKYVVAFGPQPIATPLKLSLTVTPDFGKNSGVTATLAKEQPVDEYLEFTYQ